MSESRFCVSLAWGDRGGCSNTIHFSNIEDVRAFLSALKKGVCSDLKIRTLENKEVVERRWVHLNVD